jgi:predicted phosphohydrolase
MKLAWVTDPHLNFLHPMGVVKFGEWLQKSTEADAVVLTGDIAECTTLETLLPFFAAGFQKKVYFCLGNHDFYHGSFEKGMAVARDLTRQITNLVWLDEAGVVELTPDVAIVGNGGWYDARSGAGADSNVNMSDFQVIEDFKGMGIHSIVDKCRSISREMADKARPVLTEAAKRYKTVFFATHVPPFREATWHLGKISNANWLPWFSNLTFGHLLSDAAHDFPSTQFTVLCGHTHSSGSFQFTGNMLVLTGKSDYYNPQVAKVFTFHPPALSEDLSAEVPRGSDQTE